jgi:hypothetical protein
MLEPALWGENLFQCSKHLFRRLVINVSQPTNQACPIHRPYLVEYDLPDLSAKVNSNPSGVRPPFRRHWSDNDC